MTGAQLLDVRESRQWNQHELASRLGVSQAYVSLLERGRRPVPAGLAIRLVALFDLPATALPVRENKPFHGDGDTRALGALGYEGFAYLRQPQQSNPAEVLLRILGTEDLDARVVEGLPWLVRTYPNLNWDWVVPLAKQSDLQNRLGFVVAVACGLAEAADDTETVTILRAVEARLEKSLLQKHGSFARHSMTGAEERWLRVHSSPEARRWNMLSTLSAQTSRQGG